MFITFIIGNILPVTYYIRKCKEVTATENNIIRVPRTYFFYEYNDTILPLLIFIVESKRVGGSIRNDTQ